MINLHALKKAKLKHPINIFVISTHEQHNYDRTNAQAH